MSNIKVVFNLVWDGENFLTYGEDATGVYEEIIDFSVIDKYTQGFKWSAHYKEKNQRKYRDSSAVTNSIYAMIGLVKVKLSNGDKVYCQTPDVEVHFEKI